MTLLESEDLPQVFSIVTSDGDEIDVRCAGNYHDVLRSMDLVSVRKRILPVNSATAQGAPVTNGQQPAVLATVN